MTAKNGPYLVTNVAAVRTPLGERLTLPPQLALCRCGASAMKPFCDGAHATSGFTDDKDPKRVPDQRDTYPGEQVTIFDNRGICQHSGLCTDRLPTAFRTKEEPFVAPSGARMDELIRAVRDCPSGALSLAFDGVEARDLVDWHGIREQAIEITQDGPYRVTGGLPLTDATGADVPRAAGSSREHYALCRCGHSQNKPFCSGMHWYVEFRDPVPPARRRADPVRVGRRPARADPADPPAVREARARRRPARAAVRHHAARAARSARPPSWPRRSAGPCGDRAGDGPSARPGFTEEQRARWVALAIRAADEAVLPADPQFRAALTSYLEWTSRAGDATPPAWDWGPAGPPAEESAPASTADDQEAITLARTRRDRELRGAHQAAVPRARPPVHVVRVRPVVPRRRPGPRRRHPRPPQQRHHALRRRLAGRAGRGVQALDRIRLPAVERGTDACSSWSSAAPPGAGTPIEFNRLVPFETEAMREQKARGTLTGAWSSGHPGAVLMLEVADAAAATAILAGFPLVEAGLISTEIIPLHPVEL